MAYEHSSATGVNDLIGKLKTFLEANGWTTNKFEAIGAGYRLHVTKNNLYVNLRSVVNENNAIQFQYGYFSGIALNGSTGYDASAAGDSYAWHNQPGRPGKTDPGYYGIVNCAGGMTGAIPNYYFFLDGDGFAACIEIAVGEFRWFYWGRLTMFGNVGGDPLDGFLTGGVIGPHGNHENGPYHPFTSCSGYTDGAVFFLYFNVPAYTQKWFSATDNTTKTTPYIAYFPLSRTLASTDLYVIGYLHNLMRSIPGNIGNLSPLLPCYMGVKTPDHDTLLGHFDLVRLTGIAGFTTGQEVTLGGKTWKVLPTITRTHTDGYAVAVKKVD